MFSDSLEEGLFSPEYLIECSYKNHDNPFDTDPSFLSEQSTRLEFNQGQDNLQSCIFSLTFREDSIQLFDKNSISQIPSCSEDHTPNADISSIVPENSEHQQGQDESKVQSNFQIDSPILEPQLSNYQFFNNYDDPVLLYSRNSFDQQQYQIQTYQDLELFTPPQQYTQQESQSVVEIIDLNPHIPNTTKCIGVNKPIAKKYKKQQEPIRHRKRITHKKPPHCTESIEVKPSSESKMTQLHNNLKIFKKKLIPYLLKQLELTTYFTPHEKALMKQILSSFIDSSSKMNMYYLIRNFQDSELNISKEQFQNELQIQEQNQDRPQSLYVFDFIYKRMKNPHDYEEYLAIASILKNLNSFNRSYIQRFCQKEYIPIILSRKARKYDQLFTKNYILEALRNPDIIS